MPKLSRITVYPIKSLDGHDLSASKVLPSGALANDRRYALVDGWGRYVNGKSCPAIHSIRAQFSEDHKHVTLSSEGQQGSFEIGAEQESLAAWCSEVLGKKCRMVEDAEYGLPDDRDAPGPTLVSTASLDEVANWFSGIEVKEIRRRMRFNLEVSEAAAFWEDALVPPLQKIRYFQIGDSSWQGRGVCQRCVVPTRDSYNGAVTAGFAREFSSRREASLPDWAVRERFDHFYRLGVNTARDLRSTENVIHVGDEIQLES